MEASTAAAFVLKTYQMVSDHATDEIIRWSRGNNSFVVADPFVFSKQLLPTYFKHNNFSSFVRQLNTYGFKKVDTDRWEFAHKWFLRGQIQLLKNIVRRRNFQQVDHHQNQSVVKGATEELYGLAERLGEEEKAMMGVLGQLKEEQRAIEEEVEGMSRRLQVTEKRPLQMMSFLVKLVDNPDLFPRIFEEKNITSNNKRQRLIPGEQGQMGPNSLGWLDQEQPTGFLGFQDSLQDQLEQLPNFSAASSIPGRSSQMMFSEIGGVLRSSDPQSYSLYGGGL